ncbi:hypothetical protein SMD22_00750 (plasmid) [Brevibacillus halotolerans]|nr:hypothetical protein SMD22_00750 [Brevibacillus halotolerans]
MSEQCVVLNANQKESVLRSLRKLFYTTQTLSEWIKDDSFQIDMYGKMVGLLECYYSDIAEILNYESYLTKERENRHKEIRDVLTRNSELQQMLASQKPMDGLREQLDYLSKKVIDWWNSDGFYHVSEFRFYPSGYATMEFCFMLDYCYSMSKTPVSDRLAKQQYVEKLKEEGYEIIDIEGEGLQVLDTPNNRTLLRKLLLSRFPSMKINCFGNHAVGKNDDIYVLDRVKATIYELKDITLNEDTNKEEADPIK